MCLATLRIIIESINNIRQIIQNKKKTTSKKNQTSSPNFKCPLQNTQRKHPDQTWINYKLAPAYKVARHIETLIKSTVKLKSTSLKNNI